MSKVEAVAVPSSSTMATNEGEVCAKLAVNYKGGNVIALVSENQQWPHVFARAAGLALRCGDRHARQQQGAASRDTAK